jgi:hypothetical protein
MGGNAMYDNKPRRRLDIVHGHRSTKHYYRNLKRLSIINKSFNSHEFMKGTNQVIII